MKYLLAILIAIPGLAIAQEVKLNVGTSVTVLNLASTEDIATTLAPKPILVETPDGPALITRW